MILIKKNEGTYIKHMLTGTELSLKDDELTIELSACQRNYPVHIDISENASGMLVIGPSRRYIAEIDIPACEYTIVKGEADNFGFPTLSKAIVPLDADKVSLTLWALEV